MSALMVLIALAGAVALFLVLRNVKRDGDRRLDALLAEDAEIERRRVAGVESGFAAGWHGASDRA